MKPSCTCMGPLIILYGKCSVLQNEKKNGCSDHFGNKKAFLCNFSPKNKCQLFGSGLAAAQSLQSLPKSILSKTVSRDWKFKKKGKCPSLQANKGTVKQAGILRHLLKLPTQIRTQSGGRLMPHWSINTADPAISSDSTESVFVAEGSLWREFSPRLH